jgi:hypothetical protein
MDDRNWRLAARGRQLYCGETPEIRWESHFREIGYKKIEDFACLCKMKQLHGQFIPKFESFGEQAA